MPSLPRTTRRDGFALIVALAMMAFIIVLLVSLTSLTRVETAVATATEDAQLAREYARTAMFEGLGKLQRYAGNDQVSTARGDILTTANRSAKYSPTHATKKYWTVVFDAKVFDPEDNSKPSNSLGNIVHWLVSGDPTQDPKTLGVNAINPKDPASDAYKLNKWVMLVSGRGKDITSTTAKEDPLNAVYAELENIEIPIKSDPNQTTTTASAKQLIGRKAYWAGDVGIKAKINLIDPYRHESTDELNAVYRAANANRMGIEAMTDFDTFDTIPNSDIAKVLSEKTLELLPATSAADPRKPLIEHYHDITAFGWGLQTNPRLGGLKHDLSLALYSPTKFKPSGTGTQPELQSDLKGKRMFWPAPATSTKHFDPLNGKPFDPQSTADTTLRPTLNGRNPGGPFWDQVFSYVNTFAGPSGEVAPRVPTDKVMGIAPVIHTMQVSYGLTWTPCKFVGITNPNFLATTILPPVPPALGYPDYNRYTHHMMPAVVLWNPYNVDIAPTSYTVVMWNNELPHDPADFQNSDAFIRDQNSMYGDEFEFPDHNPTAYPATPSSPKESQLVRRVAINKYSSAGDFNSNAGDGQPPAYCIAPGLASFRTAFYIETPTIKAGEAIAFSLEKHTPFPSFYEVITSQEINAFPTLKAGFRPNMSVYTNRFFYSPVAQRKTATDPMQHMEVIYENKSDPVTSSPYWHRNKVGGSDMNGKVLMLPIGALTVNIELYAGKIPHGDLVVPQYDDRLKFKNFTHVTRKNKPLTLISGIDFGNNTYKATANGSLWTENYNPCNGYFGTQQNKTFIPISTLPKWPITGITSDSTDLGTPNDPMMPITWSKPEMTYGRKFTLRSPHNLFADVLRPKTSPNMVMTPLGLRTQQIRWLATNNPRSPIVTRRNTEYYPFNALKAVGYANVSNYHSGLLLSNTDKVFDIPTSGNKVPVGYSNYDDATDECILFDIPRNEKFVFTSIGQLMHANLAIYSSAKEERWDEIFEHGYGIEGFLGENNNNAYPIGAGTPDLELPLAATHVTNARVQNHTYQFSKNEASATETDPRGIVRGRGWYYDNCAIYDLPYKLNESLWDSYFFSSITPGSETARAFYSSRIDPKTNQLQRLPNARIRPYRMANDQASFDNLFATPSQYKEAAAGLIVDGAFNVNSTSVEAWKAVLASFYGVKVPKSTPGDPIPVEANHSPYAGMSGVSPEAQPITSASGVDSTDPNAYRGFRALSQEEIDTLATEIVKQVKKRGPFATLGDFVNRTPLTYAGTPLTYRRGTELNPQTVGVLQASIDAAGINSGLSDIKITNLATSESPTAPIAKIYECYEAGKGPVNEGAPGYLTQQDLLYHLGSGITTRSDCFVIRAYGEVRSPVNPTEILSKAWCEAVVQRIPEYVESGSDGTKDMPWTAPADLKSDVNKKFGRKFVIVDFRWLKADEI